MIAESVERNSRTRGARGRFATATIATWSERAVGVGNDGRQIWRRSVCTRGVLRRCPRDAFAPVRRWERINENHRPGDPLLHSLRLRLHARLRQRWARSVSSPGWRHVRTEKAGETTAEEAAGDMPPGLRVKTAAAHETSEARGERTRTCRSRCE